MGEKSPGLAVGPVLVLFGIVGVLLIGLLSGQPRIPPATPVTPTVVAVVPTETATQPPAQNEAVAYTEAQVKQGQNLFVSICSVCHGPEGKGIPGLGKNLTTSTFVHELSDEELHQFIIVGRPVTDPLNTTGVAMPARGGNPSLTDDQIMLLVAFIRSQQVTSAPATAAPTAAPDNGEPTTEFQLPINSLFGGAASATPGTPAPATATLPPTSVPTTAPTNVTSATATDASGFQLPINSLNLGTATPEPTEAVTTEATAEATEASGFQLPVNSLALPTATLSN